MTKLAATFILISWWFVKRIVRVFGIMQIVGIVRQLTNQRPVS